MSLKSVKAKIKSIDKTRQVTKAMEAVSAVKMRKAQQYAISLRGYARSALHVLRGLSGTTSAQMHPLLSSRTITKRGVIIVSTDKGLAGSLVSNILRKASSLIESFGACPEDVRIYAIGRKAHEYFGKRGYDIGASYEKWGDIAQMSGVTPLLEKAQSDFLSGAVDHISLVYTNFRSTLTQEVVSRTLFPISLEGVEEIVRHIVPEKGKFSEGRTLEESIAQYTFEPSPESVLDHVLPLLAEVELYHAILESNASEHSARMIAMKNASDNAKELSRALKLSYNKVRQAAITREVSEIVGGMESMKESY